MHQLNKNHGGKLLQQLVNLSIFEEKITKYLMAPGPYSLKPKQGTHLTSSEPQL